MCERFNTLYGQPKRLKQVFRKVVVGDESPDVFEQDVAVSIVCLFDGYFPEGQLGLVRGVIQVLGLIHFDILYAEISRKKRIAPPLAWLG
jgi:hypothetical protein